MFSSVMLESRPSDGHCALEHRESRKDSQTDAVLQLGQKIPLAGQQFCKCAPMSINKPWAYVKKNYEALADSC